MFASILELGSTLANGVISCIKGKQELNRAVIDNKIRLAQSTEQYNHEWEMAQLRDQDWFIRRISFILIVAPAFITCFCPSCGEHIFTVFNTLPHWYTEMFGTIMFAVWGIHAIKNPLSSILSAAKTKPDEEKS